MVGMREAVDRIKKAVENREKVLIWGDLDVDGTTGTVLLRRMFSLLGLETSYHITNRFTENRGINFEPLEAARAEGFTLLVSVDTGTSNFEEVRRAKEIGMDTIICDHHEIKDDTILPPAVALVNPFHPDSEYPDDNLAGVGVAFKLAHAVLREFGLESEIPGLLKIAAIGTVADVVESHRREPCHRRSRADRSGQNRQLGPQSPDGGFRLPLGHDEYAHRFPHWPANQRRRTNGGRHTCR